MHIKTLSVSTGMSSYQTEADALFWRFAHISKKCDLYVEGLQAAILKLVLSTNCSALYM